MICGTGLDLLQSSGEFPCTVCRTGVGSNSTFCNGCKHRAHKKCSGLKCLTKDPDYRYTRCWETARPLDGRPQKEVQVGPDKLEVVASFCYLGECSQQQVAVNFQPQHVWKLPGRSSRICYQFSLHATSLSKHVAVCTALVYGAQCSMPARLGHWQSQTSSICSEMTGQWSDISAMSGRKALSPPGPMSYLRSMALRIWTSFWRREVTNGMDMWNALMVQSRQPFIYRLRENVGLGGPRWHGSSWQRGSAGSGSSRLSTLMIEICGNLEWNTPCMQQASYLEGGPLMWMLLLYLHVNQKSDYGMIHDCLITISGLCKALYIVLLSTKPFNLIVD